LQAVLNAHDGNRRTVQADEAGRRQNFARHSCFATRQRSWH
jgi:hypothetical protein